MKKESVTQSHKDTDLKGINQVSAEIVDASFYIHQKLGPGLLESVYELVLFRELNKRGLKVVRQKPVPVEFDGVLIQEGFRADLVVEDLIIIELKAMEQVAPVHLRQLLTYLKLLNLRLGLLINFGAPLIKDGIRRVMNGY
jgi:iron complex transport system substrate-binding protein